MVPKFVFFFRLSIGSAFVPTVFTSVDCNLGNMNRF